MHWLPTIALLSCLTAGEAGKEPETQAPSGSTPLEQQAAPPGGSATPRKQPETLLEFAVSGGWMMLPLCVTSILWITFLLERMVALRRRKVVPSELTNALRALIRAKPVDRDKAKIVLDSHPSSASRVLQAALDRLDQPQDKIEKAVNNAAQREIYLLRNYVWLFAVISAVSPLLGLLGTVMGLVQAFREVAITGLGTGSNLAPGIYEALVTTVGGLAVAIPAIGTYYWLMARVDHYVYEMDNLAVDFVDACELMPAMA
jgi:biopolymer transport protein ExbB